MKKFIMGSYTIFPIAFDNICEDMNSLHYRNRNNTRIILKRIFTEKQMDEIISYIDTNDTEGRYYVIDLSYVDLASDRIFYKLMDYKNIMIINVSDYSSLIRRIEEDLDCFIKYNGCYFDSKETCDVYKKNKRFIDSIYKTIEIGIVESYTRVLTEEEIEDTKPHESSNVYSNMYIDTAKLFYNVDYYRFMIFRLLCKIFENEEINYDKIDGFVSASKNGANLANIIAWLMGKKAIFCTDLGPKYSLTLKYFVDDIRPKKNYIYIFDFLCLGTEAKMLNAILNVKNANLIAGFGLASYTDYQEGILKKMHSIVNLKKEKFGYKITGEKEALIDILGESRYGDQKFILED